MNQIQTTRQKLEALIVKTLKEKLTNKEITGDRAKEIAQKILLLIPEDIADDQLLKIIPTLDDEMTELVSAVHEIMKEQDEKLKEQALPKLRAMLAQAKQT
jgi:hypothetical protein